MLALDNMVKEADRLLERYELRLEQLRLHAAKSRDPSVLDLVRRHEDACEKLRQLRAEIIRDILADTSIEMT